MAPGFSVPNRSSNTDLMVIGGPAETVRMDGLSRRENYSLIPPYPHPCRSVYTVLESALHSI